MSEPATITEPEPTTAPAEPTAHEGKVAPEQRADITQAGLNKLIDGRIAEVKTAAEANAVSGVLSSLGVSSMDELKSKLEGKPAAGGASDDEKTAAVREALEAATQKWETERAALVETTAAKDRLVDKLGVESALVAAANKAKAHDADDIVRSLRGRLRVNQQSGQVEVLTDGGNVALATDGRPLTADDLVSSLKGTKPHLFRDTTLPGSGNTSSDGTPDKNAITREAFDRMNPVEKAQAMRDGKIVKD